MTRDDWERAAEKGAVIVPFIAYSKYDATGNFSDEDRIGLRFVCFGSSGYGVIVMTKDDFYLAVDDAVTKMERVAETPEEAFRIWDSR